MLAHFPLPRPDEIFYSALARCQQRHGFGQHRTLLRLLFGRRNARPRLDLPTHLDYASGQIPSRLLGTGEQIAEKLTLLPYYLPFLRQPFVGKLKAAMAEGERARDVVSVTAVRIGRPHHMQACPKCWSEDVKAGWERYWRRAHQAPGVLICPIHKCALMESGVECIRPVSKQRMVAADKAAADGDLRPIAVSSLNSEVLRKLAVGAEWLLGSKTPVGRAEDLRYAYIDALAERGLVRSGKILMVAAINKFVEAQIGTATLSRLDCVIGDLENNWITQILRPSRFLKTNQPPLRHLVLMAALGHDAKSFFSSMVLPIPAAVALQPTVKIIRLTVCELHAREMEAWWKDETVSVSEMARRLGVAAGTVGLYAAKAGLPFPRKCLTGIIRRPNVRVRLPRRSLDEVRALYLRLQALYPMRTQTEIAQHHGGVVGWLRKHDKKWLRSHRVASTRSCGNPGLDWTKRDRRCAERIPAVIHQLRSEGTRVSFSSIGRKLGLNLPNIHPRLPLTSSLCRAGITR